MQYSAPFTWPYSEYSEYVETSLHAWHIQRLGKSGGKRILFIHGTGSSCHTWSNTVEYLLDEFEVLLKRVENLEKKLNKTKKKIRKKSR